MSGRAWLVLVAVAAVGWWFSPVSPRNPPGYERVAATQGAVAAHVGDCPLPPRVDALGAPLQTTLPASLGTFELRAATLSPLAGFSVDARVLSRRDYGSGRESDLSPTDLALGWGRMRDDAVLARLDISQSGRWYRYRYSGEPPISPRDIERSAANMHMIPGNDIVAKALRGIEAGDRVRIDGWLVEARAPDGWRWRSSLTREDTGGGACELVYVCAVTRL